LLQFLPYPVHGHGNAAIIHPPGLLPKFLYERVTVDPESISMIAFLDQIQKVPQILLLAKDGFFPIAPGDDMIPRPWIFDSQWLSHQPWLSEIEYEINHNVK
jgi:hypothetical protein